MDLHPSVSYVIEHIKRKEILQRNTKRKQQHIIDGIGKYKEMVKKSHPREKNKRNKVPPALLELQEKYNKLFKELHKPINQ